jgi:cytidine deaminase
MDELVRVAKAVREKAYAPYSHYKVGAAILTASGRVFAGCNVENASYGATICAERGAIMQMIAAGEHEPVACVVVTGGDRGGSPCGICRQVLSEFSRDMPVLLVGVDGHGEHRRATSLARLIPDAFDRAHLEPAAPNAHQKAVHSRRSASNRPSGGTRPRSSGR